MGTQKELGSAIKKSESEIPNSTPSQDEHCKCVRKTRVVFFYVTGDG